MEGAHGPRSPETYAAAGVDIAAGEEAVRRIRDVVRSTWGPEVLGDLGAFAGLVALDPSRWERPVLVAGTDTVGTKALVATMTGRYDTIGHDVVAMCVDDIVTCGARPLLFLDTISVGRLDPDTVTTVVTGVAEACRIAGCALVGGEMAENPGLFPADGFDLAGTAVGVVEAGSVITGERVEVGDVVVGLSSPGLRCNGYSLARRVLLERAGRALDDPAWPGAPVTVADELIRPSVIYAPAVLAAVGAAEVRAVAHITGGGLPGNIPRVLPPGTAVRLDARRWRIPEIFGEIARLGQVPPPEMARVFNLGVGMVLIVPPADATAVVEAVRGAGRDAGVIGEVVTGDRTVHLEGYP